MAKNMTMGTLLRVVEAKAKLAEALHFEGLRESLSTYATGGADRLAARLQRAAADPDRVRAIADALFEIDYACGEIVAAEIPLGIRDEE